MAKSIPTARLFSVFSITMPDEDLLKRVPMLISAVEKSDADTSVELSFVFPVYSGAARIGRLVERVLEFATGASFEVALGMVTDRPLLLTASDVYPTYHPAYGAHLRRVLADIHSRPCISTLGRTDEFRCGDRHLYLRRAFNPTGRLPEPRD